MPLANTATYLIVMHGARDERGFEPFAKNERGNCFEFDTKQAAQAKCDELNLTRGTKSFKYVPYVAYY